MFSARSLLLAILVTILLPVTLAAAPVSRTVGDRFEITVQYMHEPAILGDTNGVRLTIRENGEPVSGAHTSLVVQVEFMEAVRVLNMSEDPSQPGTYTGVFIPMQEGEYTFGITGTLDGVEFNETFAVADGLVNVTPRGDYEFPNAAHGWVIQELAQPIGVTTALGLIAFAISRRSATITR